MYPLWDDIVAPVLEHAGARSIVEVGALKGENTALMLERLGPEVTLHVIDPVPQFDPTSFEAEFPGRYVFHQDLSLNVLPDLGVMDAAVIDGDHNWYTVINECRTLSATARAAGAPLPVMVFHDVGWPYGRRDLYYDPTNIPDEGKHPWERRGIRQGRTKLTKVGGMNAQWPNALEEGGPRNGVLTAVEDFVEEYDRPVRLVVLPVYYGLAILAEEDTLAARPELAAFLDWLESHDGQSSLVQLGEDVRTEEARFNQLIFAHHTRGLDELSRRYLDLLEASVLGDLGRENELRIGYLEESLRIGRPVDPQILRDPLRGWPVKVRASDAAGESGAHQDDTAAPVWFRPTSMGRHRLAHLEACLDELRTDEIAGDLVDTGVGRGGSTAFLRGYLAAHRMKDPRLWVADVFSGTGEVTTDANGRLPGAARGFPELGADLDVVRDMIDRHGLLDERVTFLHGDPAVTLADAALDRIALLRIGMSDRVDVTAVLDAAYGRVVDGGWVVIEDAGDGTGVEEFRARHSITAPLHRIDDRGVCWRRADDDHARPTFEHAGEPAHYPPLAPDAVDDTVDISIVVVFYDMKREAARTLHSLSRAYQRDADHLRFEVIVVDNGSSPEQRLGPEWVTSHGPEFRLVWMGDDAAPSPIPALNLGMAEARGDLIGFMIDGAHVVTPGIYRHAMMAQTTYGPSVVAIQQFYCGPDQQSTAMAEGYDEPNEDRLFESIEWPVDGYGLFDIGTFIGDRDWFDGIPESNCLIVPRATLAQVGGFDETFDEPGGGFANLDFFERVSASPGVELVSPLGEGSFHQTHGGTTTNQPSPEERYARIATYVRKYEELRGKPYKGPRRKIHYIGGMQGGAKRTKARRRTAAAFIKAGRAGGHGEPTESSPMPADTRDEFTEAYWNTLNWKKTTWLGNPMGQPAADLFAYQQMIAAVRPDVVIDVGTGDGSRAYYLATICDLLDHGRVITIDNRTVADRPTHSRLTQVVGTADDPDTIAEVAELAGSDARGLVVLASRGRPPRLMREFGAYREFVAVGSYVVFEMTAVNGHPFWAEFGPGPAEAVVRVTNEDRDFIVDHDVEIHGMTFNPGGYLKRVR